MHRNLCIIPARMSSSRFPGKPLELIHGMPMIIHIANRCSLFSNLDNLFVATCDEAIRRTVESCGFQVIMTREDHERCTDRVNEAVTKLGSAVADDDLVIMVQGDEIMITPKMLEQIADRYNNSNAPAINIISRLYNTSDYSDPNVVKVVGSPAGNALYFSRSPIPSTARSNSHKIYQQTGIISFSASFLSKFGNLEQTPLEKIESVDMLRVVEHGYDLQLLPIENETIGVDSLSDLKRAEIMLNDDPYLKEYINKGSGKHNTGIAGNGKTESRI